jgi:hypothetical protein
MSIRTCVLVLAAAMVLAAAALAPGTGAAWAHGVGPHPKETHLPKEVRHPPR